MTKEIEVDFDAMKKNISQSPVLILVALIFLVIFLVSTVRIGRVSGEEVGILLNKLNGKINVINESGVRIYNGITSSFYVLDKTLQTLEMTEVKGRGDRLGKDNLKIKTVDGSDVYVDLKIQYRMNPEIADVVIQTSGPGNNYKKKWARDYIRALCRNYLGELTTEEFYDSSKRDAKIIMAQTEANKRLNPFGIYIDSIVIPQKPHFYAEYEAMIKRKKLADQAVLEEQSKAHAARQLQKTRIVEETNKKNVALEKFSGLMRQKIIDANAQAEQIQKAADEYYEQVSIGAVAVLYRKKQEAEGILARKTSEAKGIKALNEAMKGEGGKNLVKLEYARKLNEIQLTGKPFSIDGTVERFEHLQGAASTGRKGE